MNCEFRQGRGLFVSFIILDLVCLFLANLSAAEIYLHLSNLSFTLQDYLSVVAEMLVIDVIITAVFNTLKRVLRRDKKKELIESMKHIMFSIVLLALVLFSAKQGAMYSRATIYLAYVIDFIFIVVGRSLWKMMLKRFQKSDVRPAALLVTTKGYTEDGLRVLENTDVAVKGMFLTDQTNERQVNNLPVIVDVNEAVAFLCWHWIEKVYICGPDDMDVPEAVLSACGEMGIFVHRAENRRSFEYEVIKIRTALQKNDRLSGLSFFEGEHDIPFKINRLYTIFESEQDKQTGFHSHKKSWHMLFCPYGAIDVIVDTGRDKKNISLNDPSVGLILHPSIWRELIWKKPESILCVAASGHYETNKLRRDYAEYQKFLKARDWSATVESAEIMGEVMV